MSEDAETIGEMNGESCSRCGRANTWHPDCPTCRRIMKLQQQLTAAIARAEQAEAACVEMRGVLESLRDDLRPSEWQIVDTRHRVQVVRRMIDKALASDSGKSTADELRRLREELKALVDALADSRDEVRDAAITRATDYVYPNQED